MDTPISFVVFSALSCIFFIVRNVYFLQLWEYKQKSRENEIFTTFFPKGFKKMIEPIEVTKLEVSNIVILNIIKKVNLYSYLTIASMFLCVFLSLLESLII